MDFAKNKMDMNEECIVLADMQTSGRGKLGKDWISPEGGLWCSIAWIELNTEVLNHLFFIIGSAVCEVLSLYGVKAKIKLPNDIYYNNKKIGGILIEKKAQFVIIGIGVNINNKINHIQPNAVSYYEITGKTINIKEFLGNMLTTLLFYKKDFPQEKNIFFEKWSEIL